MSSGLFLIPFLLMFAPPAQAQTIETPQSKPAGGGWCSAHGNWPQPYIHCPKCEIEDSKSNADHANWIEAYEDAGVARRIIFGTLIAVPVVVIASPLMLLGDVLGLATGESPTFNRMSNSGRIVGAYAGAWGNLLLAAGEGLFNVVKFAAYDTPVFIGSGIWSGAKWVGGGIASGVGALIPRKDPKIAAREASYVKAEQWVQETLAADQPKIRELNQLARQSMEATNQEKFQVELKTWNPSRKLDTENIPPIPSLRAKSKTSESRTAIEGEIDRLKRKFNERAPEFLRKTKDLIKSGAAWLLNEAADELLECAEDYTKHQGYRVRFGEVKKVYEKSRSWTDPLLEEIHEMFEAAPAALMDPNPEATVALVHRHDRFMSWAHKKIFQDTADEIGEKAAELITEGEED